MTIAGVEVRAGAAAKLASLLSEHGEVALATHLGRAIDHVQDHFTLTARDRETVLRVLTLCPPELENLRGALSARTSEPRRAESSSIVVRASRSEC